MSITSVKPIQKQKNSYLCVYPELVKHIELTMHKENWRRHHQGQRHVKNLQQLEI